ncbi:MAG: response regulator [Synergistaceae bacterium]|jgi:response regulator RpfG family c-di-GMP phosphodiesterase|nr:response regulator [Synergistaceae bacterium]
MADADRAERERPMIMIVDDDVTNLKAAKNSLVDFYEVFTVPSAEKMFDLLQRNTPKLILLDINMPGMDGYEALKLLKANSATSAIPVIFLTAIHSLESELDGVSLGAADYISKPFLPQLLRRKVELHLMLEAQRRLLEIQVWQIESLAKDLGRLKENVRRAAEALQVIQKEHGDRFDSLLADTLERTTSLLMEAQA